MKKRYLITVREKSTGNIIEQIRRIVSAVPIGNYVPLFCRYMNKTHLIKSESGFLDDPFRRTEKDAETFYIEIPQTTGQNK